MTPDPDWESRSACKGMNTHWFFPSNPHSEAVAKAVCATCPVKRQCYESALTSAKGGNREQYGIFGGINFEYWARDRRRENKRASRARRIA